MTAPSPQVFTQGISQVGADQLNTFVQICSSVVQARTFVGISNMAFLLLGTTAPNDGGQGHFYWNPTSTAPDDGGVTTIVPTGAVSGAWNRLTGV